MSDSLPKISVLVAVYNGAQTLQRCLDRFAAQTYANKELIVMDGGSTDGTPQILANNTSVITYWESQSDGGIYHAWNKAIARSTGDWICFLGADDYFWSPDVLEKMAERLAQVPMSTRVVYGKVAIVSKSEEVLRYEGQEWDTARHDFTRFMTIPHPGLLHRRSLFDDHGVFDETFRLAGDYDLLLRELKTGNALFVSDVTTVGMQHGGVSHNPAAMGRYYAELTRLHNRHSSPLSISWRFASVNVKMALCALTVRVIGDGGFRSLADLIRRATGRAPIWRQETGDL